MLSQQDIHALQGGGLRRGEGTLIYLQDLESVFWCFQSMGGVWSLPGLMDAELITKARIQLLQSCNSG